MNEDGTGLLTIGELARLTGVSVKTIRSWSDQDLLPPAARTPAGYRLYGPDAPARLEIVRSLRELGIGLAAVRSVLHRELTVAETAAQWADALDAQIGTLRLQSAVLRSVAARGSAAEELPYMTELARLSARERRRIIADFVEDALDGVDAPAYRSGLLAATPDLPDDPTPEQIGAWIELAALVREPELRAALRRLAEYSARTARPVGEPDAQGEPRTAAAPDPAAQERATQEQAAQGQAAARVAELMRVRGEAAVAAGIAPDSPAAEPVIAELVAAWLPTQTGTADPPTEDDPAARARLLEQLETAAEPVVERYWQLLCTVTGRPAPPRWDTAGTWTTAALRAHPGPYELDRSAFDGTDPDRVLRAYEQVTRDVAVLVAAVRPEDLALPTPCAGWSVRELLDHMVWENLMATSIAEDAPRGDHTADHLGDDHRAAFDDSVRAALAAFTGSGMLRRTYGPYEAPGAMIVQQVVVELLAHGWDLARATGAPTGLAPEAAEETLAAARRIYGAAPRTEGSSFAPERPAPPGASATDRLAAFLGRDPA
ncbi:TIGR03086 family metal-binding protein [Streptomyces sp. Je 1-4]|uniref:TIGR03086 family metal-binding protein n=1 Tax=Streptomyces TaxID=1883 RepID=UPI00140EA7F3|nr:MULTISPECIES: TIGR03086 family metal-binding protein [unclassified Streptomyces]QIK09442.1 TIGR03086 family protein [Streptomyces sp. ID38640]UYB43144.1 TIGR03086 family metal-binding protein [Streptomyces sp. Je 1-4]UZQ39500.1 TIGR03086 family metal-binding protein [Streptomyces sp. Je 1-4] [Streptomyces sp. Je 1-4 4N24]UZQ46917.1 TIGR03086 family metal-binding protein [Streptomyces sp. Je 1-4] [Streptomyces sp. Je 1-4 4N24_ara]